MVVCPKGYEIFVWSEIYEFEIIRQKITDIQIKKSNLHYTRSITPKRVTSGGVHLSGLAPGQHSSEETSQRWRAVGDSTSDLTGPGIEPAALLAVSLTTLPNLLQKYFIRTNLKVTDVSI